MAPDKEIRVICLNHEANNNIETWNMIKNNIAFQISGGDTEKIITKKHTDGIGKITNIVGCFNDGLKISFCRGKTTHAKQRGRINILIDGEIPSKYSSALKDVFDYIKQFADVVEM
jgi:hypothetical protein